MKYSILLSAYIVFSTLSNAQEPRELRVWTSKAGTTLQARMNSATDDSVILERSDGKTITVPLKSLSQLDQKYVTNNREEDLFADPDKQEEQSSGKEQAAVAPPLPQEFPKDLLLDTIPWLKELKSKPLKYEFTDFITKQKMNQDSFKGKYIYIYTESVSKDIGTRLTELKLLHAKYGKDGFAIISLFYNYSYSSYEGSDSLKKNEVKKFLEQAVKDYGVDWAVCYSDEKENPLAKKLGRESNFQWLLSSEGTLLHSKINSYDYIVRESLNLKKALGIIFE